MRFKRISLTNTRLVGNETKTLSFREDKNVVVLLGDNGLGKTTILDALASSIAPFPSQFPGISDYQLRDWDVHINRKGRQAPFLTIDAELSYGNQSLTSVRYRKGLMSAPKSKFDQLKQIAIDLKDAIVNEQDNVQLPIFAYYGTGRGQFRVPARRRGFQKTYERWDCYQSALKPETDFKRFFGWFDLMESEELHTMKKLQSFAYRSPVLETVRRALSLFVPSYQNPRIEMGPLRFVMDCIDESELKRELRIEQLSDGYKIVIAMVADLAARMAEANPQMQDPLDGTGIVLIDEVDLHLHPQWQRTIINQLVKVFPHIQFIVSTHSPVIVIGASENAQIINLNSIDEASDITKSNVGAILLSDLFGLSSLKSPIWDDKILERDTLLAKAQLNADEQKRLEELDREMVGLTSLQDSHIIRSNQLLEKIAQELQIKL